MQSNENKEEISIKFFFGASIIQLASPLLSPGVHLGLPVGYRGRERVGQWAGVGGSARTELLLSRPVDANVFSADTRQKQVAVSTATKNSINVVRFRSNNFFIPLFNKSLFFDLVVKFSQLKIVTQVILVLTYRMIDFFKYVRCT